jgi:hypothetical protein
MLQSVRKCLFILAFLLSAQNTVAEDRFASKNDDWTCFSTIELQAAPTAPISRIFMFSNNELLAEIEQGATIKRYLVAQPSGIELYAGLSADESVLAGPKNPFQFLELNFGVPLMALQTAFPAGPSSVPDGESKKDILVRGKPITISTTRRSQHKITYRLESASIHATGLWKREAQNPLPGSYSLVGWTNPTKASFATLEEARSVRAPQ